MNRFCFVSFVAFVCFVVVLCIGCEPVKTRGDGAPTLGRMTYEQVRAAYNDRIAPIDTLWVRSVVEIRWTDEEGDRHFEQGDGPLIVRRPSELALAIGKLGNTRFWLGCDAKRYWLFDLEDPRTAYVGEQDNIARAAQQVLPLPIRPDQLIGLIGLQPLPDAAGATVEAQTEHYRVTLPASPALGGLEARMKIDTDFKPVHIALLDAQRRTIVDATLESFTRMRLEGRPPGAWPWMPQRVHVVLGQGEAQITLFMRDPAEGGDKVRDVQFDFERLVKAHQIAPDRVIDVDQPPAEPR